MPYLDTFLSPALSEKKTFGDFAHEVDTATNEYFIN